MVKPNIPPDNELASTTMPAWICLRCDYVWPKRDNIPVRCPECGSAYWNKPRQRKRRKRTTHLEDNEPLEPRRIVITA